MNERMKQILDNSGLDIRHDGIVLTKNTTGGEALEKFADLIVEECCDFIEQGHHSLVDRLALVVQIKKHFGLKK